jgi:hypothetical protein
VGGRGDVAVTDGVKGRAQMGQVHLRCPVALLQPAPCYRAVTAGAVRQQEAAIAHSSLDSQDGRGTVLPYQ